MYILKDIFPSKTSNSFCPGVVGNKGKNVQLKPTKAVTPCTEQCALADHATQNLGMLYGGRPGGTTDKETDESWDIFVI